MGSLPAPYVFADNYTSTHFVGAGAQVSDSGGYGTSTGFSSVSEVGQQSTGESTSTSFTVDAGGLYYSSSPTSTVSQNWRWYSDENHETPTTALADENVAASNIDTNVPMKLRVTVHDLTGVSSNAVKYRLQYSTNSDFSGGGTNVVDIGSCDGSSTWCYADGVDTDNAVISTATLSDADSCVASAGNGCGTHNESGTAVGSNTQVGGAATEYEFTVKAVATIPGQVYFFRLLDVGSSIGVPSNDGNSFPSLVMGGGVLSFSIDGLPTATSTEGVTTNIETTADSIPFGTLPIGSSIIGAQRLSVSTNAGSYEIYTFQDQALIGNSGQTISGVTGTNSSPSGWSSGCTAGQPGCFGYHAGKDVLSGGSTRFAADDTYAQFTGAPSEVGYGTSVLNGTTTDMVYRVQVRDVQDAGDYSSNIVYVIVPVF